MQQLHGEEAHRPLFVDVLADVVEPADVGVGDPPGEVDLAAEAGQVGGVEGDLRPQAP